MSIGVKIKEARIKKGVSLQIVADKIGVSKTHIWDLERGHSKNPSIALVTKLANYYGLKIATLVGESPETDPSEDEIVVMYRGLKELDSNDLETIRMLMERLKMK